MPLHFNGDVSDLTYHTRPVDPCQRINTVKFLEHPSPLPLPLPSPSQRPRRMQPSPGFPPHPLQSSRCHRRYSHHRIVRSTPPLHPPSSFPPKRTRSWPPTRRVPPSINRRPAIPTVTSHSLQHHPILAPPLTLQPPPHS